MPAGRRKQTNTMLYTLVVFVGLFLVTTVLAIVFYLKFEDQREIARSAEANLKEMATTEQWQRRASLVGSKQPRETYLGKTLEYLDQMVTLIVGGVPEDTSAEAKANTAKSQAIQMYRTLARGYVNLQADDPNFTGLLRVIDKLRLTLDATQKNAVILQQQLQELRNRFDNATAANLEKEKQLLAEKDKLVKQVETITNDYNSLKTLLQQETEQQVQGLLAELDKARADRDQTYSQLLKAQEELNVAQKQISSLREQLQLYAGGPENAVAAYQPDGRIIVIDKQNDVVHIDIGRKDGVYRGLTFSVYDKSLPIPKDGKGKAQIEVFDAQENFSVAKVTQADKTKPIILYDYVANLIWDKDKVHTFVVFGDFDVDGDGVADYDGAEKIKALVRKWGGAVAENVSVQTDFLVLGDEPVVLPRPTAEELAVDPMAMDKYNKSLARRDSYRQIRQTAQMLSVPIFNLDRFLYFAGYKAVASRAGAF